MKRTITIDLPDTPEGRKTLDDDLEIYADMATRHLRGTVHERCCEPVDAFFDPVYKALSDEIKRDENPAPTYPYARVIAACIHNSARRTWFLGPDGNWYAEGDLLSGLKIAFNPDDWDSLVDPKVITRQDDPDYLEQALRLAEAWGRFSALRSGLE